ncbi:MAG: DUF4160 domain-containing protein [Nitrospirae bacterium]|nr:DUF4160 domain-containing protein [Nitrospirota bacterium]
MQPKLSIRFFFNSGDSEEPVHVHVERGDDIAKFWLEPARLQMSRGFSRVEISNINKIINEHHLRLLEAWNEYFGS